MLMKHGADAADALLPVSPLFAASAAALPTVPD